MSVWQLLSVVPSIIHCWSLSYSIFPNYKAEVDVINAGDECGIGLIDFEDFQAGDIIESYVLQKQK